MNDLKVFSSSEFGELGVLTIDGKEYFPATACAKILGYTNPKKAIIDHCKGVTKRSLPTAGGEQGINLIPEGDLYRLIVRSRLPTAERFEQWVFDEVLPTIRKQGTYGLELSEIISRTVQATVTEMMRLMGPGMSQDAREHNAPSARRRTHSLIGKLDTELRQEVEDLICERKLTYFEISAYLADNYGILISKSSIDRYAKRIRASEGS